MSRASLRPNQALAVDTLQASQPGRGLSASQLGNDGGAQSPTSAHRQAKLDKWDNSPALGMCGVEEAGHDFFKVALRIRPPTQVVEGMGDLMRVTM